MKKLQISKTTITSLETTIGVRGGFYSVQNNYCAKMTIYHCPSEDLACSYASYCYTKGPIASC